jgi:hypothetical protein
MVGDVQTHEDFTHAGWTLRGSTDWQPFDIGDGNAHVIDYGWSDINAGVSANPASWYGIVRPPGTNNEIEIWDRACGPQMLSDGSFENGANVAPWKLRLTGSNGRAVNNSSNAQAGSWYLEMNNGTVPISKSPSVYQDIPVTTSVGQKYTFWIWVRSPTAASYSGKLALWGRLGGTAEAASTPFTTAANSQWTLVSTTLTVNNPGHTSLRAEIYMQTVWNLDVDAARVVRRLAGEQ